MPTKTMGFIGTVSDVAFCESYQKSNAGKYSEKRNGIYWDFNRKKITGLEREIDFLLVFCENPFLLLLRIF
ncbi:MAG: hypothetical protein R2825_15180 [Saprospiraceae bacterium]